MQSRKHPKSRSRLQRKRNKDAGKCPYAFKKYCAWSYDGRNITIPRIILMRKLSNLASFDTETIGMTPYQGSKIFSYCVGWVINQGEDCTVDVCRLDYKDEAINKRNRKSLQDFLADTDIIKVTHNLKYDLSFLISEGYNVPKETIWHDTMIMSQLLRNLASSHGLDAIAFDLCGYQKETDKKVEIAAKTVGKNYSLIDKNLMTEYQICDGERTALIYLTMIDSIKKDEKIWKCYLNEIELIKVTQRMEQCGMMIDRENIAALENWLEEELTKVRNESYALVGEFVNLNSDEQVARLLFRKYGFKSLVLTDSGQESTDKDVISTMKDAYNNHPIFDLILRQRSYSNALSTLRSYLKFAGESDIIHPNINTNRARTGRQSSSKPNLQNVRKEAALKNPFPVPLRRAFRARPKKLIYLCDYSGIEMRLIIEATQERELMEMLIADPDADVHYPTLECFLGVKEAASLKSDNPKEFGVVRGAHKNVGFCVAYGGGVNKVAVTLDKRVEEIREGDARYRQRFQRVANFTQNIIAMVRKQGYIETSFGRHLSIPPSKAYIGSNYLIQGTAAEILKRAEVSIDRFLRKATNDRMRIIMCVHDELIYEMDRELLPDQDYLLAEISRLAVAMPEIKVPLRVEWKMSTTSWADAKKMRVFY